MVDKTNLKDATNPNPSSEDLARQVELLKADIGRLTQTMTEMGKAKGRAYSDEARRRATAMRSDAEHKVDDVEEYVRENPATALGIAALVGLIVGFMTRR